MRVGGLAKVQLAKTSVTRRASSTRYSLGGEFFLSAYNKDVNELVGRVILIRGRTF